MWLFLPEGFYSIVRFDKDKWEGPTPKGHKDLLMVRARARADLRRMFPDATIYDSPEADYPHRVIVSRRDFALVLSRAVIEDIQYTSFKDEVYRVLGEARAKLYLGVWSILRKMAQA